MYFERKCSLVTDKKVLVPQSHEIMDTKANTVGVKLDENHGNI